MISDNLSWKDFQRIAEEIELNDSGLNMSLVNYLIGRQSIAYILGQKETPHIKHI